MIASRKTESPIGTQALPDSPAITPEIPQVSVIIVTRNQASELRRAISALENSKQREQIEILVVDCGSSDDIRALGDEHPSITMLYLPDDFGATKALNIGVRTAKSDLLLLLSPDVDVQPDTVPALMERLEGASDAAAVCPLLVDTSGQPTSLMQPLPTKEMLAQVCAGEDPPKLDLDLSQESIAIPYAGRYALLIRKQFIIGMNYFDKRFGEYWADADLALQIRRAGRKVLLYPSIRAVWHDAGKAADPVRVCDRYVGAALLLGKYDGFLSALGFRVTAILGALVHFDFSLLSGLLSGKTVGSQAN